MRAPKDCSRPDCTNVQPCPEHERKPWAGSTRRSTLPRNWEALRRIVLDRDPVCTDGRECKGLATSTEVHHVRDRDDHRLENLAGICSDCHGAESSRQGHAAQGARA